MKVKVRPWIGHSLESLTGLMLLAHSLCFGLSLPCYVHRQCEEACKSTFLYTSMTHEKYSCSTSSRTKR